MLQVVLDYIVTSSKTDLEDQSDPDRKTNLDLNSCTIQDGFMIGPFCHLIFSVFKLNVLIKS